MKALHRHNGIITFMVKGDEDDDGMVRRFAIRADALDTWFPEFAADLVRNSFVSINASYTLADRRSKAPYGMPAHETTTLRFLCACYVDIDYYKRGISRLQVRQELERMWDSGELPDASMVVDSGRGMWLLWLLHDAAHPDQAHLGAYNDNVNDHLQLYTRINKALYARLDHIGADHISDGVRSIRVPGSFRNDTETSVTWRVHGNSDRATSYTLKDLAAQVGVSITPRSKGERAALDATRAPRGNQSNGWKKTNHNRLAAMRTILDQRAGGFQKGCRNIGAFHYALSLRGDGEARRDTRTALLAMGAACDPPLSLRECLGALKSGYKARRPKVAYKTIADQLDVTPAEAEIISQVLYGNCQSGDRRFFPAAQRFGQLEPVTNPAGEHTRRTKCFIRHEAIRVIVGRLGYVPAVRVMQQSLLQAGGIEAAVGTLFTDYKALDLVSKFTQGQESARIACETSREHTRRFLAA